MTGLEAISHYNGWAQAVAGILIVMAGLSCLSFAISQLHKVAALLEGRKKEAKPQETVLVPEAETVSEPPVHDLERTADAYQELVRRLGTPFQLSELYRLCQEQGFTHPHMSIKALQEAGVLKPLGDGAFTWQP